MEFDEKQENDPSYLIKWYQSRIDYWKKNNPTMCEKVVKRYELGIARLKQKQ
tara:strand:- start:698 stop:853 length:156 start_codon:yes stop_codon:yes gene_type:complete